MIVPNNWTSNLHALKHGSVYVAFDNSSINIPQNVEVCTHIKKETVGEKGKMLTENLEVDISFYEDKPFPHPNDFGFRFYETEENNKKLRFVLPSYNDYMCRVLSSNLSFSILLNNLGVVKLELDLTEDAKNLFKESIAFIPKGIDYRDPYNHLNYLI